MVSSVGLGPTEGSGHLGLGLMEIDLGASYQIRDGGAGCM